LIVGPRGTTEEGDHCCVNLCLLGEFKCVWGNLRILLP
jgi:hypothetical protein